ASVMASLKTAASSGFRAKYSKVPSPKTCSSAVSPVRTLCRRSPHDRHTDSSTKSRARFRIEPGTLLLSRAPEGVEWNSPAAVSSSRPTTTRPRNSRRSDDACVPVAELVAALRPVTEVIGEPEPGGDVDHLRGHEARDEREEECSGERWAFLTSGVGHDRSPGASLRPVGAEAPEMPLEVPDGELARPVVGVLEGSHDLGARRPGTRVVRVQVLDLDVHALLDLVPGIVGATVLARTEHDHAGAQLHLRMRDVSLGTGHDH